MSIMDLFRPAPTSAPVAAQPTPGQIPANPAVTPAPGTGDVPAGSEASPNPDAAAKSPMDAFTDLWKTTPNPTAGQKTPMFNLDPEKLMTAAKSIDFSKAITNEQLQAVVKGGEDGAKAFAQAIQAVAATTLAHSAITSGTMVEQAVNKARTDWMKEVPGLVKSQNLRESTSQENPALSHPAAAPIVDAIQSQMQVKFPNATAAELRAMTSKYFDGLARLFKPATPGDKPVDAAKGGDDWSNFLS